jgi:hypothetical protein
MWAEAKCVIIFLRILAGSYDLPKNATEEIMNTNVCRPKSGMLRFCAVDSTNTAPVAIGFLALAGRMKPFARLVKLTCAIAGAAASLVASSVNISPLLSGQCSQITTGPSAATCYGNNGASYGDLYGTFQGLGHAQASAGSLHADATANYNGVTSNPNENAYGGKSEARAELTDNLRLSGAPQQGFLRFMFQLDVKLTLNLGFPDPSAVADASLFANSEVALSFSAQPSDVRGSSVDVAGSTVLDVPYYTLSPNIDIILLVRGTCTTFAGPKPGTCFASADFSNTAVITGLGIADANHQIVSGATFTAASGYAYPTLGSSTMPEPSGFLPAAIVYAFAIMFVRRRWRVPNTPDSPFRRRFFCNKMKR